MSNLTRSLIALLPVSTLTLFNSVAARRSALSPSSPPCPITFGVIYLVGDINDTPEIFFSGIMLNTVLGTLLADRKSGSGDERISRRDRGPHDGLFDHQADFATSESWQKSIWP